MKWSKHTKTWCFNLRFLSFVFWYDTDIHMLELLSWSVTFSNSDSKSVTDIKTNFFDSLELRSNDSYETILFLNDHMTSNRWNFDFDAKNWSWNKIEVWIDFVTWSKNYSNFVFQSSIGLTMFGASNFGTELWTSAPYVNFDTNFDWNVNFCTM